MKAGDCAEQRVKPRTGSTVKPRGVFDKRVPSCILLSRSSVSLLLDYCYYAGPIVSKSTQYIYVNIASLQLSNIRVKSEKPAYYLNFETRLEQKAKSECKMKQMYSINDSYCSVRVFFLLSALKDPCIVICRNSNICIRKAALRVGGFRNNTAVTIFHAW